MQINTVRFFFYFNEHVLKDMMILDSEEQRSTTFNHLLSREKKTAHAELWQTFTVPLLRSKEGKINLGNTHPYSLQKDTEPLCHSMDGNMVLGKRTFHT